MTGILGQNNLNEYVLYYEGLINGKQIVSYNLSQILNIYKNYNIKMILDDVHNFVGYITNSMLFIGIRKDTGDIDKIDLNTYLFTHKGQRLNIQIDKI